MKSLFNKFIFFVLSIIFFSYAIAAKEITSEYKVEVGNIDIGKLFWSIDIDETKYEIFIKLEDWGFFSGLYNFNGSYNTKGRVVNNSLVADLSDTLDRIGQMNLGDKFEWSATKTWADMDKVDFEWSNSRGEWAQKQTKYAGFHPCKSSRHSQLTQKIRHF